MSFKKDTLSISELDLTSGGKLLFPQLLKDYINGEASLQAHYQLAPELSSFSQALEQKANENIDRTTLVEVLTQQYTGIGDAPSNIALLAEENTFTITTGHQLCLFTGPLYFCYKILTVINITEQLRKEHPDKNFVPMFWMASEDHDFEEVNHFHLFGKTMTWEAEAGDAVGRMSTSGVGSVVAELKEKLSSDEKGMGILKVFEKAYSESKNLAEATRVLVHSLFGKYGLVIIDADDSRLKARFRDVMKAEVEKNASMHAMQEAYDSLSKSYSLPVKSRNINLFYFHDGKRRRLEQNSSGNIEVLDTEVSFSVADCVKMIEEEPQNFSPNVVLRPLYEEMILPNLAYIGGPAEIAYWLELKGIFDIHNVSFPILMQRNSLLILGGGEVKRQEQYNLSLSDLLEDPDKQVKSIVTANSDEDLSLDKEKGELSNIYKELLARAKEIDASLEQSVKADESRAIGQLDNLEKKLLKAAKRKNESGVNQIKRLFEAVFPNGSFQERYDSLFSLLVRYDLEVIDQIKDAIDPFDSSLTILSEN
ncbi:MAG: bacillithiol biosynthesis cysteine-adding enzyme BshC [Flavobacteriales bacterium]|nr:bacillithiol biosynthesis cysteine-adding enzyme BshC [Flavobacteriales bacterium]